MIFFICKIYGMNVNILADVHKIKKAWMTGPFLFMGWIRIICTVP
ncbi:MAG: hypothetical protein RL640_1169 [Bacteroidota bacterium]|jgi:hypothetical protein